MSENIGPNNSPIEQVTFPSEFAKLLKILTRTGGRAANGNRL